MWISPKFKEEKELVLYPNKSGTVGDLLEEARKHLASTDPLLGKLRYVAHFGFQLCDDVYVYI